MQRCSRFQAISLAALMLVPMAFVAPAMASHETVVVDGNLADLIIAVNNNLGESNGGFTAASALGNIYSPSCSFVNGFDIRNVYAFFDFKEPGGAISNSVDLYLGWEVEGVTGDVDGDNSPDTFTMFNAMCANNGDAAGIGSAEATISSAKPAWTLPPNSKISFPTTWSPSTAARRPEPRSAGTELPGSSHFGPPEIIGRRLVRLRSS